MRNVNQTDLFVTEGETEVDARTAAAIERGLRDAKAGRVVTGEKVPALIRQWISKFSTPKPR